MNKLSEHIVLGGLIIDNEKMYDVMTILTPECFVDRELAMFYRHLTQFHYDREPFDAVSISDRLGEPWLNKSLSLVQQAAQYGNVLHHAKIIYEKHQRRVMRSQLAKAIGLLVNNEKPGIVIDKINAMLESLNRASEKQLVNIGDGLETFNEEREEINKNPHDLLGLSTGLKDLDDVTQGLQPGNFIVVAGRPAMGKSILAQLFASTTAINAAKPVLFYTLEMPKEQMQERLICSVSNIELDAIQTSIYVRNPNSMESVNKAITKIKQGQFIIDDSSSLTIEELRSKSISYARKSEGVAMIVVDYLQLLSAKAESRFQEISIISRELKRLAKRLNCPVVALSQLNRKVEQRDNKRPNMGDLRESGQIEQDADLIVFIYRDEEYNENTDAKGIAELIVGKARGRKKRNIVAMFDGAKQTFRDAHHLCYETIARIKADQHTTKSFQKRYSKGGD